MSNIDTNRAKLLNRYKKLELSNANEAETRIKLIDEILRQLLGWTTDDISYEERVSEDGSNQYADYILRTANTALLIEAKRIGDTFDTGASKRRRTLSGPILEGNVGAAIKQAREYCQKNPYLTLLSPMEANG